MQNKHLFFRTPKIAVVLLLAGFSLAAFSAQAAPTPTPGYSIQTFGTAPAGATNPDSIAVSGNDVFIGYADKAGKTGGGTSTIAEFNRGGTLLKTFSVSGHNDGLKIDPATGNLWAMQNEDGNPNLAIINPVNGSAQTFNLTSSNSGGGYDDIVFQKGNVYFSASNAQNDPNTDPAIVRATQSGGVFTFTPVLLGNATATNALTGAPATLDLTDADSLTIAPGGGLLLTDQTANQLVTINAAGTPGQTTTFVGTSSGGVSLGVDDTVFPDQLPGSLLVSDTSANTVYAIDGPLSGQAFSAAPNDGFVAALNLGTGALTPIVTGFGAPKGMAYLPAAVPEPSALAAFGVGILMLIGLWKRRMSRAVDL